MVGKPWTWGQTGPQANELTSSRQEEEMRVDGVLLLWGLGASGEGGQKQMSSSESYKALWGRVEVAISIGAL